MRELWDAVDKAHRTRNSQSLAELFDVFLCVPFDEMPEDMVAVVEKFNRQGLTAFDFIRTASESLLGKRPMVKIRDSSKEW